MEISWPVKSSLKSRLSRSGVMSTRILPGMAKAYAAGTPPRLTGTVHPAVTQRGLPLSVRRVAP